MNLLNKTYNILKQILIVGSITTLLLTTITCGGGNNKVGLTQADIEHLRTNWQQALNTVNNGLFQPNNNYNVSLMLSELYTNEITSTENLTISLTSSKDGITINPANYIVAFNEALDFSFSTMLMIDESVEGSTSYTISVALSSNSELLEGTLILNLDLVVFDITQANVDNFRNTMKDILETESSNFIQAGNSFTLNIPLNSLYSSLDIGQPLTSSTPLTISFTSSDTDITLGQTSYEVPLSSLDTDILNWMISYSDVANVSIPYSIDITIRSDILPNSLSTILYVPFIGVIQAGFNSQRSAVNHTPVLVLSNFPVDSSFTYTLEQASSTDFVGATTTIFTYSNIDKTTLEYILNDTFSFSDWGLTLTNQFYRLSVYDSDNTLVIQGNTSDTTEIILSSFADNTGDGSEANPYQISNVYQLQEMGTTPNLDAHFTLVTDIDATETLNWANGAGFNPIDTCSGTECDTPQFFKGSLDGQTYNIRNLTINQSNIPAIGLFGAVAGASSSVIATIENLTLSEANIQSTATQNTRINTTSRFAVGSFVGYLENHTDLQNLVVDRLSILSSSANANVDFYSGSLVGLMNGGSISSSISYSILSSASTTASLYSGGLVGQMGSTSSLTSSISYSILSSSANTTSRNVVSGGLVGQMDSTSSLTSSISYSILSSSANTTSRNVVSGGLVGQMDSTSSLSSSISYSILSSSSTTASLYSGGLVGWMNGGSLHRSVGVATHWSAQSSSGTADLGSLIGRNTRTINNNYVNTRFLILNNDATFRINPSRTELPLIDNNTGSNNCSATFTYSEALTPSSGSSCPSDSLFHNFTTYDSDDTNTEPDWSVSDTSFYPRPTSMPSAFDISELATQDEYRMMASHSLIRFYNGTPIDNRDSAGNTSNTDDIVDLDTDDTSNVLFITHKTEALNSIEELEEAYYPIGTSNIYISQGLDATLLSGDNTIYTNSDASSTKFTYTFALAPSHKSTSSSSITVGSSTLTVTQNTTGTYITGISSLSSDDDFYIEVTVNSSISVTSTGNNTSFSRRYRFKKE